MEQLKNTQIHTCNKVGKPVIDVHQAVGTCIGHAPERVSLQLLPCWLSDAYIIVLHPALVGMVVDVGPVMACWRLAFVDQHCMESVRYLTVGGTALNSHGIKKYGSPTLVIYIGVCQRELGEWVHVLPGRDCCLSTCPQASEWACQCWPLALTHTQTQRKQNTQGLNMKINIVQLQLNGNKSLMYFFIFCPLFWESRVNISS